MSRPYAYIRSDLVSEARRWPTFRFATLTTDSTNHYAYDVKPTDEFLSPAGAWSDDRSADEIISDIRRNRRNSSRLAGEDRVLIDTDIIIYSFRGNRVVADNSRTHGAEPERSTQGSR